jgi:hypothetical protein
MGQGQAFEGLYSDSYARKRALHSASSHLTTEAHVRTTARRHGRSDVLSVCRCEGQQEGCSNGGRMSLLFSWLLTTILLLSGPPR